MKKSDPGDLTLEEGQLLNIYDRLAGLGRAVRKSTAQIDSQTQHAKSTKMQLNKTVRQNDPEIE